MTNQNTAVAKPAPQTKPSALNLMASRLNIDPVKLLEILKATVFKGATDNELGALVMVSNTYTLDPLLKEIYAFPAKGGGICPIVSVDGWNKMLLRQPEFDGIEFEFEHDEERKPVACTATVFVKNRSHPLKITEYFDECFRNTDNWKNMPHRMLRNRTLCQASRLAFGFSGIYNEDEASTIIVESTVMPSEAPPKLVAAPIEKKTTPQAELAAVVLEAGCTFNDLQKWAVDQNQIDDANSLSGFDDIAAETAKRLLRNKTGLINNLKAGKV